MRAHARRAQPGVPILREGFTCGCHNGATVFLAGASRAGRHRICQACQQARHAGSTNAGTRDGLCPSDTASSRTPRAADPRRTTGDSASSTAGMHRRWEFGLPQPARRPVCDGILATFVRTALALLTHYYNSIQQQQDDNLLCDECWLQFPWNNNSLGVRRSPFFIVTLLLCCCVRCSSSCVCACPP
ncbi:mucin TcMUC [Trypanosoma cruzi]|nr:mucin TcMUC [Trypanosoma cruzi]